MTEDPKFFKRFFEIDTRPDFDVAASITLDNFQSLVGEYHFDEEVICQVRKSDGNCGHKHLHGWLGKTKEGKEGLIGGHCASKYFNASENFSRERNRVRRELNIINYVERLSELLKDRNEFFSQINTAIARLRYIRESVKAINDELPRSVVQALRDMAKTGNRAVLIQIQYIEEDKDGKKEIRWVDQNIGSISGVGVWEPTRIQDTFRMLSVIKLAAEAAEITREAGERRLKTWMDTLSELPRCASRIDDLEKDYDNFATFENLKRLCYLIRNYDEQCQTARHALKFGGIATPSAEDDKRLLNKMNSDIRSIIDGRNFRVA